MRSIAFTGLLLFALTFCGLGERLKQLQGTQGTNSGSTSNSSKTTSADAPAESPKLTSMQQAIADGGDDVQWSDQGITFRLPKNWKKMDMKKESLNYGSPDNAFLIASISVMPDNFPSADSLKATYDSALEMLKQGKYESARYAEIDGIKGVEFVEAMPEDKDGPRRHQWIAFRNHLGQNQQLNIMVSTKGTNFDKHRDDFAAILYTMKIQK
jgi:hypothetical protein